MIQFACPNRAYRITGSLIFTVRNKECGYCKDIGHNRRTCPYLYNALVFSINANFALIQCINMRGEVRWVKAAGEFIANMNNPAGFYVSEHTLKFGQRMEAYVNDLNGQMHFVNITIDDQFDCDALGNIIHN